MTAKNSNKKMALVLSDFSTLSFGTTSFDERYFDLESANRIQVQRLLRTLEMNDMALQEINAHRLVHFRQDDYARLARVLAENTRVRTVDLSDVDVEYAWLAKLFEVVLHRRIIKLLVMPRNFSLIMSSGDVE